MGRLRFECRSRLDLDDGCRNAFATTDTFEEEFGDVFDGDVFGIGFAWRAAEHALAKGASYGEDFFSRMRGEGLLDLAEAIVGDALVARLFFFPELGSAGSAAEGVFAVAGKLGGDGVAEDIEEIARGFIDAVVAAEIAGIVIGDSGVARGWREFFVRD